MEVVTRNVNISEEYKKKVCMSACRVIVTKMSKKWVDFSLIKVSHLLNPLIEISHFTCCPAIPCLTKYEII